MERRRVLVAIGDVLGFGTWTKRAANAPEDIRDLVDSIYAEFEKFAGTSDCYIKFLGDGLLAIREIGNGHNCGITAEFMKCCHDFSVKINELIASSYPRPEGFRLRMTAGYVWKRKIVRRSITGRRAFPEYIGYPVNLAQRLLDVSPETFCICHDSVRAIVGEKKLGIKFEHMGPRKENLRGVDHEDVQCLWSFMREEKNERK